MIVAVILGALRKIHDVAPSGTVGFDGIGALLSIAGLSLLVFGVLKSGTWGLVKPKPAGPVVLGTSPVVWLALGGLLVIYGFFLWEGYVEREDGEPLIQPRMLRNRQLTGGLTMFFFQFFIQAGVFFTVPLFLSVVLELSALQTGVRLLPLPVAPLVAAIGIPRLAPGARPPACCSPRPGLDGRRDPGVHRRDQPWRRCGGSSPSRCCCSDWASAPWPPSSARSPSRPSRQ